jgi:glycosyltransferase involved in cell wall biosynthesis
MQELPLVTIVTPVYQMVNFIDHTLRSVFDQDYPNIQYIVMDAGSTDGTLEVVRRYEDLKHRNVKFEWFSERDTGAADAVNKGFLRSSGSVFAYLNADDTYMPGAVSAAARALLEDPSIDGVYGEANWVRADGSVIGRYPTLPFDPHVLMSECFICQPASFLRREAFAAAGMLNSALRYSFDYDFWIRISKTHRLRKISDLLATSRMHDSNKTIGERRNVLRETIAVLQQNYGYSPFRHVLAYTGHLADGQDQFSQPFRPSLTKYLMSLPLGWRFNWRHPLRYTHEWASAMSFEAMLRRVSGSSPDGSN